MKTTTTKLFEICRASKNPALAFSRACSKVGYLARSGPEERRDFHYLESALNEAKHATLCKLWGDAASEARHLEDCARYLASYRGAIGRREPASSASTRPICPKRNGPDPCVRKHGGSVCVFCERAWTDEQAAAG